jgi:cell division protein ZapA (FtsZ GTPase activity inhibitor)
MAEFVTINVHIAGADYPIKAKADDEAVIKEAGQKINNILIDLQKAYAGVEKKDLLAMGMIQLVSQQIKEHSKTESELNKSRAQLSQFESLIAEFESKLA